MTGYCLTVDFSKVQGARRIEKRAGFRGGYHEQIRSRGGLIPAGILPAVVVGVTETATRETTSAPTIFAHCRDCGWVRDPGALFERRSVGNYERIFSWFLRCFSHFIAHLFASPASLFAVSFHKTFIRPPFLKLSVVFAGLFGMAGDTQRLQIRKRMPIYPVSMMCMHHFVILFYRDTTFITLPTLLLPHPVRKIAPPRRVIIKRITDFIRYRRLGFPFQSCYQDTFNFKNTIFSKKTNIISANKYTLSSAGRFGFLTEPMLSV